MYHYLSQTMRKQQIQQIINEKSNNKAGVQKSKMVEVFDFNNNKKTATDVDSLNFSSVKQQ